MQNPAASNIFLASTSRYRRELMDRLLDTYEAVAPGIVEDNPEDLPPAELAVALARRKAEGISANAPNGLIIAADQIAVLGGEMLGKPGNHQKAVEQLLKSSGKTVEFLTSACILDPQSRSRHEYTDRTIVRFKHFDRRLAETYLKKDEPYDCAGSFKVEGAGVVLFQSVETEDPTALVGLPMIWVADRLLQLGYLLP